MNKHFFNGLTCAILLLRVGTASAQQTATDKPLLSADFEQDAASWMLREPTPMSQVAPEAAHSGTLGLRVTDADEKFGSSTFSPPVPLESEQGLSLSYWGKTSTGEVGLSLWFYGENGKNISGYQPASYPKKGDDWAQYQLFARAPLGATSARIWIHSNSGGKTVADFDDFRLETATGPEITTLVVPVAPDATGAYPSRTSPAYVVLKLDDLVNTKSRVPGRWKKFTDFIKERNIHAAIGIIGKSLEGDNPEYSQWIKDQQATGLFEFWNHGYSHAQWKEGDQTLEEFRGPTYEAQLESLTRTESLAREKLGFPLATFGAPFNTLDENTTKALAQTADLKIWLYGDALNSGGKVVLDRVNGVNIENPTFQPNLDKFIDGYQKYPDRPYFVIQGHPNEWNDARFGQFVKVVDYLIEQKAIFVTPTEYVQLKKLTAAALPGAATPKVNEVKPPQ